MATIDPFEFFDPRSGRVVRIQPIFENPDTKSVAVTVRDVIACVNDPRKWFLVRLADGTLTIARVDLTTKRWTAVPEAQWPSLEMNDGLPEKVQVIECVVCQAWIDVFFPCSKRVDELTAICPACGYTNDVEQTMLADDGGDVGEL